MFIAFFLLVFVDRSSQRASNLVHTAQGNTEERMMRLVGWGECLSCSWGVEGMYLGSTRCGYDREL